MTLLSSLGSDHATPPLQTSLAMTSATEAPHPDAKPAGDTALSLWTLRPGQYIEVHTPGHQPYRAVVEDTMPRMHIAWIRDLKFGERRMLCAPDHSLHRC